MIRSTIIAALFLLTQAPGGELQAQLSSPVNTADSTAVLDIYYNRLGDALSLNNGRIFMGYPPQITGSAFYQGTTFDNAAVLFEGTWYKGLSLIYDVYSDEVIVRHPRQFSVILINERVQQFTFSNHKFIRVNEEEGTMLKTGFYQVASEGRLTFLIKRSKILKEEIIDRELKREFVLREKHFIQKDGVVYAIRKKKDLLSLVKDKKEEVEKLIKENNLDFKEDPEKMIRSVADFYNK